MGLTNVKVGILSLGCPKNLVDSEVMLGILKERGYQIVDEAVESDVAIVNTCGFIQDAKEESIDVILQLARLKKEGKLKALIVAGCLPQRYPEELDAELKEADGFLGTGEFYRIADIVEDVLLGKRPRKVSRPEFIYDHRMPRKAITPRHYAYVKIAEGCNNPCSFCIIPKLRGRYRSRRAESIVEEARRLTEEGAKEIILISQDSTLYGKDIYGRPSLARLLRDLTGVKSIRWLRILYNHPGHLDKEILSLIRDEPAICKYLDLPLQHVNSEILNAMSRKEKREDIMQLITAIRKEVPGVFIRTSFIVGFPGENETRFKELLDFIREAKFERLGAFIYSREEGTPAALLKKQIPLRIKQERLSEVMKAQREISSVVNHSLLNKEIEVIIDEKIEEPDVIARNAVTKQSKNKSLSLGRSQWDAPEVDGQVFIQNCRGTAGDLIKVKIIDTYEYDLVGAQIT